MLDTISSPQALKGMSVGDLEALCVELRQEIISVCLKNGGHLGASLGTVELTVALHRIFDSPRDRFVWDVGHQAYSHKCLTGRANRFSTLRKFGGISGFLAREESEHDWFGAGHSSTSISAALGLCFKNPQWTIAVVGDGGLTAGLALEALNNIRSLWTAHRAAMGPMLIVLNDNQMSISENVGGIPQILASDRAGEFFSNFGLEYLGPVNGHDLMELLGTLNGIRSSKADRPILLHVHTQKGKGYLPAEARPASFHGVGPARAAKVESPETQMGGTAPDTKTWSEVFGAQLVAAAEKDERIVAITAAMVDGTGLLEFSQKFPDRFFDVGIAEAHAVTFAAGLAAQGWRPVCAIYSTFLQRGIDSLIHDVALQKLPVLFAVDRAGLVGADGPTHHGVFDLVYSSMIPSTEVYVPTGAGDLRTILENAWDHHGPTVMRYPRGTVVTEKGLARDRAESVHWRWRRRVGSPNSGGNRVVVTLGPISDRIDRIILEYGIQDVELLELIRVKPIPEEVIQILTERARTGGKILFFEDGIGEGSRSRVLFSKVFGEEATFFSYPDRFISHGQVSELESQMGWSDQTFAQALMGKTKETRR